MRLPFAVPLLVISFALPAAAGSLHPKLLRSTPAADSTVAVPPEVISATFNERITIALSTMTLWTAESHAVPLGALGNPPNDDRTLMARVSSVLSPGRYTVKWLAAGRDGHPMRGAFTFVVARKAPNEGDLLRQ
jgi:methionine-rich copper-binding protein CopC